jgi:hypothetical protein
MRWVVQLLPSLPCPTELLPILWFVQVPDESVPNVVSPILCAVLPSDPEVMLPMVE